MNAAKSQHGRTRFQVTATTSDENSLKGLEGYFQIKILELATSHSVELAELT